MFRAFTLVALAAYASAQLSPQCTAALQGIIANPAAAECLGASSLLPLLANTNSSLIIPSVDNWLQHLCAVPACSNTTLTAVTQNITTGCQSELGLGLSNSTVSTVIGFVEQDYPTFREAVCLKEGDTNCIVQTLTNFQDFNITTLVPFTSGADILSSLPTNISCTNCLKAIYNTINKALPSSVAADAVAPLQSHCGASFVNGTTPSGIVESATTSTSIPSNVSAASGRVSHGVFSALNLYGLVLISTMFTLLA